MAVKPLQKPVKHLPGKAVRKAVQSAVFADKWAIELELKVDGKQFSTKGREYVVPVMRDRSSHIVIPKAAQTAFTTTFIVVALHNVVERHWHGLYLLPLKTGSIPFVQGRIDPIIDGSPMLSDRFTRVENRMHKQTTNAINLYIRGTNIETELREVPVDFEVWDERDKMVEKNLTEAKARMDGSNIAKLIEISTPTAPGHGIDSSNAWHASDQHRWEIPCPACSRYQVLTFEESVKLGDSAETSTLECQYCSHEFTDIERIEGNSRGHWSATKFDGDPNIRGYHISQLNSPTKKFRSLMSLYFEGQESALALRAFHNNGLGQPFSAPGDQFTEKILDDAVKLGNGLRMRSVPEGPIYVGVDIGTYLHVKASWLDKDNRAITWLVKLMKNFDELDKLLESLNTFMCVIDAHPEKHKARELSLKYPGRVWVGFLKHRPEQAGEIAIFKPERPKRGDVGEISIDRDLGLDEYMDKFTKGGYLLPFDCRELGEDMPKFSYNGFYHQHLQMARVEEENAKGTIIAHWRKNNQPDHWHHASLFEMVAMMKKPKLRFSDPVAQALSASGLRG